MTAERLSLIGQIEALPELVAAEVEFAPDAQLDTVYKQGGWTVRQVVHHLADSHMNAFIRMRLILTEDHPTLKPYQQDDWARFEDSSKGPVATSLAILRGVHARWATMLRLLPDSAWLRTGYHPENGTVSIDGLLHSYAEHGLNHLKHIRTGLSNAKARLAVGA